MTDKLLARDEKKGNEIIPSILCLVRDDFWGSHSPVFCGIRTLSIDVALESQKFKVLQSVLSAALTWVPGEEEESKCIWFVFFLMITLLADTSSL